MHSGAMGNRIRFKENGRFGQKYVLSTIVLTEVTCYNIRYRSRRVLGDGASLACPYCLIGGRCIPKG